MTIDSHKLQTIGIKYKILESVRHNFVFGEPQTLFRKLKQKLRISLDPNSSRMAPFRVAWLL